MAKPTKRSKQTTLPPSAVSRILVRSRRRCALCSFWNDDRTEKSGQIAHIDRDQSNESEDNLAFLCLEHHAAYDQSSKQSKDVTPSELREACSKLYDIVESESKTTMKITLTIVDELPEFTEVDQLRLLEAIRILSDVSGGVSIKRTERG